MKRKKARIVIIILSVIVLALAAVAAVQALQNVPGKIIGTYGIDNLNPTQNVYIAVLDDGTFQVYNPNREMYSGTYQEEPDMITDEKYMYLTLHLEDGTRSYAIFDRHDRVILDRSTMTNLPEQLRPFIRISDTPILISTTNPE